MYKNVLHCSLSLKFSTGAAAPSRTVSRPCMLPSHLRNTVHSKQSNTSTVYDLNGTECQTREFPGLQNFVENRNHAISQRSKFKTNQYHKIRLQILDVYGAKMFDKCVKSQKKLYIVLLCKVKLSKMASIKTNKIKKQTALF